MKTTKPFGIADKLGYMFGDFANDFAVVILFAEILHRRYGR